MLRLNKSFLENFSTKIKSMDFVIFFFDGLNFFNKLNCTIQLRF